MTAKHSPEIEQFLGTWLPLAALKTRDATERHLKIEEMARTGSIELAATAHLLLVQEVRTGGNGLPEVVSLTCTGRDRKDRLQLESAPWQFLPSARRRPKTTSGMS
jgi:hypothetical protein